MPDPDMPDRTPSAHARDAHARDARTRDTRAPMRHPAATLSALLTAAALAACSAPVPRAEPGVELPARFHHEAGWLAAAALDGTASPAASAAQQAWWRVFEDPVLDRLLREVGAANASLEEIAARVRQAEAVVAAARAEGRPQLGGSVSASRSGSSANGIGETAGTRLSAGLAIAWTPDLWGRIALQQEATRADAAALAADLAAARLALELSAAQHYVRLRTLERRQSLLLRTLDAYQRSLQLTRNQYDSGFVARADVIQAEAQLQSVRTQLLSSRRQHALELNALAELTGRTPSGLQLAPAPDVLLPQVPATPEALPSSLLVRRPDLAAAQRRLAAANARIGVARTAWLPDLSLGASASLQADRLSRWLEAPVRVWSLGPTLAAALLDGGARRSLLAQAEAAYDAQAAAWRASVLQAVRETEDTLASLAILQEQAAQQEILVALAEENLRVVDNRYQAGVVSFLEVATAQNLALDSQRNALEVQAERLIASMQLVAALGGGWQRP